MANKKKTEGKKPLVLKELDEALSLSEKPPATENSELTVGKLMEAKNHIENQPREVEILTEPIKSQPIPVEKPQEKSEVETQTEPIPIKIVYSFPTQSRCPRCQTTDTVAYRTDKNVQYRKCLRAVCRQNYSVIGTKI